MQKFPASVPVPTRRSVVLGLVAVLLLFCLPLLVGLSGWDMRNDEAIYSYAVDRIIDTGEWLTPRTIPTDNPFLEKPPLKFWMVAAGMRAGLLPHDDTGQRLLDALFGAIAFIYVYLFGVRLAGPVCGFVAVLLLFTLDPVVFDHGLRSANMEAPLFLSYCGGMYHFARWAEGSIRRQQRIDAVAVALYFVLGFMTKFVAAVFLPAACLVGFALKPDAWSRLRAHWRDWILPIVVVLVATVPWFVYETRIYGRFFWDIILGAHVVTRFTESLDPSHLRPWHFYFSQTWIELHYARSTVIMTVGALMLAMHAWTGQPWLVRLLIVWCLLPLGLISLGTSKLIHYAYPFWPPLALGGGLAAVALLRLATRPGRMIAEWLVRYSPGGAAPDAPDASRARLIRRFLIVAGVTAIGIGIATAVANQPLVWQVGGVQLFKNSSVYRPLVIGALLLCLGGYAYFTTQTLAVLALSVILPVPTYLEKARRVTSRDHPLRALRDCGLSVQASGGTGKGTYNVATEGLQHQFFYYLRALGPWVDAGNPPPEELQRRLFAPGEQTAVVMSAGGYRDWARRTPVRADGTEPKAVATDQYIVLLLPGPFQPCATAVTAAGGRLVERTGDEMTR